jgi:transcriptional regulator with XRE-family HTH domain
MGERINPGLLSDVQNNVIWECVRIRLAHDAALEDVARLVPTSRQDIQKWENGRWLHKADAIIKAYAELDRVAPRTIWARAIREQTLPPGSPKAVYLSRRRMRPSDDEGA